MKALITGGNGQLGQALCATAPDGIDLYCLGSGELDICDESTVHTCLNDIRPDIVLNAAAYTAVDRAEQEEERALAVNGTAVGFLSEAAMAVGARFAHVSTDFVFDGRAGTPYLPDAPVSPLSAYGRSKVVGEQLAGAAALIVRTAWVYAPTGQNFVRTMLRLMAERPEIRVVADQVGTPTYAPALAEAIWKLSSTGATGLYHYTDSGAASWYDFAVAIQEEALAVGLLGRSATVIPIRTIDYPTPAPRPSYSILDKTSTYGLLGKPAAHWRENLRIMIARIAQAS